MYVSEYKLNNIPFFMHNRNIKNHDKFTLMAYNLQRHATRYVGISNFFIFFYFVFQVPLNAFEQRQAVVSSVMCMIEEDNGKRVDCDVHALLGEFGSSSFLFV
jgi:hypothetical protein